MSGVSVEDGKYVIVRGLGERYTTTALNGAVIPSAETDRKVVPLDLFPTNLLEGITTSKTFTPDQPGDFSGARVDLKTKEFPAGRQINIGVSAGFNTAVTGQNIAKAPTVSGDWFGNGAGPRALPSDVAAAGDLSGTNQAQLNTLIGSFRNVWAPDQGDGNGAGGFNASIGGEDPLFGHMFGYLASFSYAYAQEVRTDQTKGVTKRGDEVGTALPLNQYSGSSASGSVLWGGMLNFSTRIGANSKFDFNNTYTRGADNSVEDLGGFNEEFAQDFAFSRLTYIQRSVRTNQLVGNHLISPAQLPHLAGGHQRCHPGRAGSLRHRLSGPSDRTRQRARAVPVVRPDPLCHPHLEHARTSPTGTWAPTGSTASARSTAHGT